MGRILNIIPKYAKFFIRNADERYVILQGGRRSGKSVSVYQWVTLLLLSEHKECVVLTATYPAAMNAVKDFQLATGLPVTGNAIYGHSHIFENGSVISFRSFDDPQKTQGTMADIAIVEEALNIDEQIFTVFSMGIREQCYFLYNPTKSSWTDKYLKADKSNYLKTTWKDNPYLKPEQVQEFELIRERAERPTATILDIYNKKVYYDGEFGDMAGTVFKQIFTCTDEEFDKIDAYPSYGLDFGFTDGGDETAMTSVKIHNNCLYIKQLIYSKFLGRDEDLDFELKRIGIKQTDTIVADFGGLGKTRIYNLRETYGWDIINCQKNKIIDDLQRILQFDKIIVTESSTDLRRELENYELTPEGKPKNGIADHLTDSCRYGYNFAKINQFY